MRGLACAFRRWSIGTRTMGYIGTRTLVILFLLLASQSFAQIKIYERTSQPVQQNDSIVRSPFGDKGLYFETPTRRKMMLNGEWNVSFNNGGSYAKLIVPCSYDFSGSAFFDKSFSISADSAANCSFILVAEGINNSCEIKLNDVFITKHTGAGLPVIAALDDGIIRAENKISIVVNSELGNGTLPLANQVNFGRVAGGITQDIYILCVPKVYSLSSFITFTFAADNTVKLKIAASIKSTILDKYKISGTFKSFHAVTKIFKKQTGEEVFAGSKIDFNIENNNLLELNFDAALKNAEMWSPDAPNLYLCKTEIFSDEELADEFVTEFGIVSVQKKNEQFTLNGNKNFKIYGTNYFENSHKFGAALDYSEVLAELTNIKKLGFNTVRVPGYAAHPYILNAASRIGLMVMEDVPFNEVPGKLIRSAEYTELAYNYISQSVMRDRNYPCILAYGLGNEFDVTVPAAQDYIKNAKVIVDTLNKGNKKFTYYTTSNYKDDICFGLTELKGQNFYDNGIDKIVKYNEYYRATIKQSPALKNTSIFVASFGIAVNNDNRNGYSDAHSQEAQTKYFVDAYKILDPISSGLVIAAYADYPVGSPELYPMHWDKFIRTNGIFTVERVSKQAPEYLRRLIAAEETPKILEGSVKKETPQIFLITGLICIGILIIFLNQYKRFREYFFRCIFQPNAFFLQLREQMIVPVFINIMLTAMISIGMAIFFANIFYYYKEYTSFDVIVNNFLQNNTLKLYFIDLINEPWKFILAFTLINIFLNFLTCLVLYFISLYIKGRVYFKNIYIIAVWSSLPLLITLPLGTVLYKLTEYNISLFFYSLIVFLVAYILYIVRLIKAARTLFELRSFGSYVYGFAIFIILFVLIYFYFSFFTNAIDTLNMAFHNIN